MKTLITTALLENRLKDSQVVFLGEWCKRLNAKNRWTKMDFQVVPYHWNDNQKLSKDYHYLYDLYEVFLSELHQKLNQIHDVHYSKRYWRILIGPWLCSYISALWDRWENINRVCFIEKHMNTIVPNNKQLSRGIANNYLSSIKMMANSDKWNFLLYCSILRWQNNLNVTLIEKPFKSLDDVSKYNKSNQSKSTLYLISRLMDIALNKSWFNSDYKFVLYKSYLSPLSLIKLSLRLSQPPRIFSEFEKEIEFTDKNSSHRLEKTWFSLKGDFEGFVCHQIVKDIPKAYLENYITIQNILKESNYPSKAKVIMTANAHYHNEIFKAWTAAMTDKGSRLVIAAHGGALRMKFDMFEHEENISDFKTTWHIPVHSKHFQVAPNISFAFGKSYNVNKGKYITLVGLDTYRYANRLASFPISASFVKDLKQKIQFIKLIKGLGLENIQIRPYPNSEGWSSTEKYIDEFGEEVISKANSIKQDLMQSKVVICTYPQTTFFEAMHFGVPTMLLYVENLWELNDSFLRLFAEMKRVGIFHGNAESAASHLNAINEDPLKWWNDSETKKVRQLFGSVCGRPSKDKSWEVFLKKVLDKTQTSNVT